MPILGKARIEVFIPLSNDPKYKRLLEVLPEEISYTFGGCSIITKVDGYYLDNSGKIIVEDVCVLFVDIPFTLVQDREILREYTENLMRFISDSLNEESVLITVNFMHHTTPRAMY